MPTSLATPRKMNGAAEYYLMVTNALLMASQTDEPVSKHKWNLIARAWKLLAIAASAEDELERLGPSATVPDGVQNKPASLSTARVLVAEDNAINQMIFTAILEQGGMESVMTDNGAEAVEAWEREHWDVILMDIQMPVLDGVGATRAIRLREASLARGRTPIIAVTANVQAAEVREYIVNGMDEVVAKPINIEQLFAALERVLSSGIAQHGRD